MNRDLPLRSCVMYVTMLVNNAPVDLPKHSFRHHVTAWCSCALKKAKFSLGQTAGILNGHRKSHMAGLLPDFAAILRDDEPTAADSLVAYRKMRLHFEKLLDVLQVRAWRVAFRQSVFSACLCRSRTVSCVYRRAWSTTNY